MAPPKGRTISRTIQGFTWSGPHYAVEWVETPEDVPEYDPVRGANPYAFHSAEALTYDDIKRHLFATKDALTENRENTAGIVERQKLQRHINQISTFLQESNSEHEVDGLKSVAALDGSKAPPPLKTTYEYPTHTKEGLPFPFTQTVNNYPRLVRSSKSPFWKTRGEPKRLKRLERVRVCEAIADLYSVPDEVVLRARILETAECFGPLDPFDIHSDSLEGWKRAVFEIGFLLNLLHQDSELRAQAGFGNEDNYYVRGLAEWLDTPTVEAAHFAPTFRGWLDAFSPYAERNQDTGKVFARFEETFTELECRKVISALLWRRFAERATNKISPMNIDGLDHLGLVVGCGALGWAYLELWDAFSKKHVKRCKVCHRLFIASKANADACPSRSGCKRAASPSRQKTDPGTPKRDRSLTAKK